MTYRRGRTLTIAVWMTAVLGAAGPVTAQAVPLNTSLRALVDEGGAITLTHAAGGQWRSLDSEIAIVEPAGKVRGLAAGVARLIADEAGSADTALVVVRGARSVVATALPNETEAVRPGALVSVPVRMDLSRWSAEGDLGALEFDLGYDPEVLHFDSATVGVRGSGMAHEMRPGQVRFAFASTSAQGDADLLLATLHFHVRTDSPTGGDHPLALRFSRPPASTAFIEYPAPLTLGGVVRVRTP